MHHRRGRDLEKFQEVIEGGLGQFGACRKSVVGARAMLGPMERLRRREMRTMGWPAGLSEEGVSAW